MIGVICGPGECRIAQEFFELFKTPWEFWRDRRRYDAILCAGDYEIPADAASTIIVYGSERTGWDHGEPEQTLAWNQGGWLTHRGLRLPIYGESIACGFSDSMTRGEECRRPLIWTVPSPHGRVIRVGYDLFREIHFLLNSGQPAANASIPAAELHIQVLRYLLIDSGIPLVEIPPVPAGYRFAACLTHDVDHPLLRAHGLDWTTLGFLYRALVGSCIRFFQGRLKGRDLLGNWLAAAKVPLIHLGLAGDSWSEFAGRYLSLEGGLPSTFFVLPFAGKPGHGAPRMRAARYGAADIACQLKRLMEAGCEIGLHGIDAWWHAGMGREEVEEVRRVTGRRPTGVRMHWLYSDEDSPGKLEDASVTYDSTAGYNETVGFRFGTAQVYRPPGARELLELPLHIMDTALFYPSYLNLSPGDAQDRIAEIVDAVSQLGGCVTVNWHDRSVAHERQWTGTYSWLIELLRRSGAWFATGSDVVEWYRVRRAASFEEAAGEPHGVRVHLPAGRQGLPSLQLRVFRKDRALGHFTIGNPQAGTVSPVH